MCSDLNDSDGEILHNTWLVPQNIFKPSLYTYHTHVVC